MKTSCVVNPKNERIIIVREWQVNICNNKCASMLLSYFIHWEDILYSNDYTTKEKVQAHTIKEIQNGILNYFSDKTIRNSLQVLNKLNLIIILKNKSRIIKGNSYILNSKKINEFINKEKNKYGE